VGVPPVRPEQQQPVELGLDVRKLGFALGEDSEKASVLLEGQKRAARSHKPQTELV